MSDFDTIMNCEQVLQHGDFCLETGLVLRGFGDFKKLPIFAFQYRHGDLHFGIN